MCIERPRTNVSTILSISLIMAGAKIREFLLLQKWFLDLKFLPWWTPPYASQEKALVPLHVAKGLWRMNRVEIVVINSDCSGSLPTGALRLFTPVESPEIKYLWQRANRRVPPIRGPLPVASSIENPR